MIEVLAVLGIIGAILFAFLYQTMRPVEEEYDETVFEPTQPQPPEPAPGKVLYEVAKDSLGMEMSPEDRADDTVACVESLEGVHYRAFGYFIGGKYPILATWLLEEALEEDPSFMEVSEPECGDIIISPTYSGKRRLRGHTGVMGDNGRIYSNNSMTGLWDDYFTRESWHERYTQEGGLTTRYFRKVVV